MSNAPCERKNSMLYWVLSDSTISRAKVILPHNNLCTKKIIDLLLNECGDFQWNGLHWKNKNLDNLLDMTWCPEIYVWIHIVRSTCLTFLWVLARVRQNAKVARFTLLYRRNFMRVYFYILRKLKLSLHLKDVGVRMLFCPFYKTS